MNIELYQQLPVCCQCAHFQFVEPTLWKCRKVEKRNYRKRSYNQREKYIWSRNDHAKTYPSGMSVPNRCLITAFEIPEDCPYKLEHQLILDAEGKYHAP